MSENRKQISLQEAKAFAFLKDTHEWLTAKQLASKIAIPPRTARAILHRFASQGLVEVQETFPEFFYKWKESKEDNSYYARLAQAAIAFGFIKEVGK